MVAHHSALAALALSPNGQQKLFSPEHGTKLTNTKQEQNMRGLLVVSTCARSATVATLEQPLVANESHFPTLPVAVAVVPLVLATRGFQDSHH